MKRICLSLFTAFFAFAAAAQDAKLDVDIDTNKGGGWYTNPIVWVIGAAVFILLLVALLRGGRRG